jgi:uncharacterized protein YjiK
VRGTGLILAVLMAAACGNDGSAPAQTGSESARLEMQQWTLPNRLNEISGLALTDDERLLAVTDEIAVVYELDYTDGHLVKAFAFGDPPVRDDFEGIAVRNGVVWLMTSDGRLLAGPEGGNGDSVGFEQYDTGLRRTCELEGMSTDASGRSLALICKEERGDKDLQVFVWNPDTDEKHRFELPEREIEDAADEKEISPSGIEVSTRTGNYLVVAARQNLVFELAADGRFSGVIMRLDKDRHRQAEGITMTADGRLLIADEAGGGRARLAVYRTGNGE